MTYDIASFDATQKNVMIFGILAPRAFQRYIIWMIFQQQFSVDAIP